MDIYKNQKRVTIYNTNSNLDGKIGTIRGIAQQHPENIFYVVELDEFEEYPCVVITNFCIRGLRSISKNISLDGSEKEVYEI